MKKLWCLFGVHTSTKWELLVKTEVYWQYKQAEGVPMYTERTYTAICQCCGTLLTKVIKT